MSGNDWLATRFEEHRPRMRAVAYRMLGTMADADDAVQEAWLRLARTDADEVDNLGGWLTTVVARECLKVLRTRRRRREEPLPESPLEASPATEVDDPEARALLADSVGPALMVVLDTLAPAERLAFVLHDVFAVPFDEIAAILGRSAGATRQLASRARTRVHGATPPGRVDLTRQRRVVDAFLAALHDGDVAGLLAVLDPDVTLHDDSATRTAAAMRGAQAVAAHAAGFSWGARFAHPALIGDAVGVALVRDGRIVGALAFTHHDGTIIHIDVLSQPDRRRVELLQPGR